MKQEGSIFFGEKGSGNKVIENVEPTHAYEETHLGQDSRDLPETDILRARDSLVNKNWEEEQLRKREADMKKAFEFDEAA